MKNKKLLTALGACTLVSAGALFVAYPALAAEPRLLAQVQSDGSASGAAEEVKKQAEETAESVAETAEAVKEAAQDAAQDTGKEQAAETQVESKEQQADTTDPRNESSEAAQQGQAAGDSGGSASGDPAQTEAAGSNEPRSEGTAEKQGESQGETAQQSEQTPQPSAENADTAQQEKPDQKSAEPAAAEQQKPTEPTAAEQQKPTEPAAAEQQKPTEPTAEQKVRAERFQRRQLERESGREAEAAKAEDVQTATQTIQQIKPTSEPKTVEQDGQRVRTQSFTTEDGRRVEKSVRRNENGDKVVRTRVERPDGSYIERERVIDTFDEEDHRNWRRYERRHRRGGPRSDSGVEIVIYLPQGTDFDPDYYVVDDAYAPPRLIRETLRAEPLRRIERRYTVEEVTQRHDIRALVPRIDLHSINFAFGSAVVERDELRDLDQIAAAMREILRSNPNELFLLEGHTDAVGSDLYNLQLSELRAQAVKFALVDGYDLPEDAFVTEGYGEEYLKVPTQQPERLNRRVTVRRITALVQR